MEEQQVVAADADQAAGGAAAAAEAAGAGGDLPGGRWPALQRPRVKQRRRKKAQPETIMRSVSSSRHAHHTQLSACRVLTIQSEQLAELSQCGACKHDLPKRQLSCVTAEVPQRDKKDKIMQVTY